MNFDEIYQYPAKKRAGLQLVDCVASSFYAGLELTAEGVVKPDFAKNLLPRLARSSRNRIYGFGLKVWPEHAPTIVLPKQRPVFDFYINR